MKTFLIISGVVILTVLVVCIGMAVDSRRREDVTKQAMKDYKKDMATRKS